jgi:hypothetical protein
MANNTAYWWYVISGLFSKYELTVKSVSTSNQIYDLFSSHIKRCLSHMSMKVVVLERSTWVWVQILRRYYTRHRAWDVAEHKFSCCHNWSEGLFQIVCKEDHLWSIVDIKISRWLFFSGCSWTQCNRMIDRVVLCCAVLLLLCNALLLCCVTPVCCNGEMEVTQPRAFVHPSTHPFIRASIHPPVH